MNAGLALGCFSGIRRVQGRIWEVVGRKGPNPEQHGRVSRISVSSWEGPRGGQESVGRPVEALWMELGWSRWTKWPTNKDSFSHNHGADLMTEEQQEWLSQRRPKRMALSSPDGTEPFPFLLAPQRNGKESGKGENSEQSDYLSKRDLKNSHWELTLTPDLKVSCLPSLEIRASPKSQVMCHFQFLHMDSTVYIFYMMFTILSNGPILLYNNWSGSTCPNIALFLSMPFSCLSMGWSSLWKYKLRYKVPVWLSFI